MDKELLRMVIIVSGIIVVIGMLGWSFFKSGGSGGRLNGGRKPGPLENIDDSLVVKTDNDDYEIIPLGSAVDEDSEIATLTAVDQVPEQIVEAAIEYEEQDQEPDLETGIRTEIPELIQFGIVAEQGQEFNGEDLIPALQSVGLIYGDLKIFERLDEKNQVLFRVASIVNPGTFPEDGFDRFSTPGIVFFMQPGEMENPGAVFDDLITILHLLSGSLGGIEQDHHRIPLTQTAIDELRKQLSGE